MRDRIEQMLINLTASCLWTVIWEFLKNSFGVALPYIYSFQVFGLSAKYYTYGSLQSFALCVAVVSPIVSNRAFAGTPGIGREAQFLCALRYGIWISLIFISLALLGARFSFYFKETMVFQ
jgi:hypothetical protein